MINFWAFIYRATGWYSPCARLAEYKYIKSYIFSDKFLKIKKSDIVLWIDIEIGYWQARNGFVRPFKFRKDNSLTYIKHYWTNLWRF